MTEMNTENRLEAMQRANGPLLEVKNLQVDFTADNGRAVHAVRDSSFSVYPGQWVAIVGESGSGKTTIGRAIIRINPMSAGEVIYKGEKINGKISRELDKKVTQQIQMIFQDPIDSLDPRMTVEDIITEGLHIQGKYNKEENRKTVEAVLKRVGLIPEYASRYPHEFSGGMKQRIVIAMALVAEPELLLADEPTTALDVTIQAQILRLMKNLQQETGASIMLITHDLGVIRQMSDDVIVMYCGQIVESGTVGQIFSNMSHPYTMGLLASIPTLKDDGGRLKAIEGMVPSLYDLPTGCRFHPRCPYATDECRKNCPQLREVEPGHYTRCFRDSFGKE